MLVEKKAANLKTVAAHVGLAPCSVSAILNNTKASRAIPQATKDRVYRAASELNYRPNHWARSLRTHQTRMVAVLTPDLDRSGVPRVVSAAQRRLHQLGYLLVLISSDCEGGNRLSAHVQQRGIEGVIAIDTAVPRLLSVPVVTVDVGLGSVSFAGVIGERLLELGESAAERIIQQIENSGIAQRTRIGPKLPRAFFEAQTANLNFASSAETA